MCRPLVRRYAYRKQWFGRRPPRKAIIETVTLLRHLHLGKATSRNVFDMPTDRPRENSKQWYLVFFQGGEARSNPKRVRDITPPVRADTKRMMENLVLQAGTAILPWKSSSRQASRYWQATN